MPSKSPANFVQCPVCRTSHLPTAGSLKDGVYASTCQNCGHFFKFKATGPYKSAITFTINGQSYTIGNEYAAALSLNEFMRSNGVSYGTKVMCMEGGCGVCLVTTTLYDPITMTQRTYTVNSCLLPLYTCDGMQVTTIEGLGNTRDGLHPIQERLAQYNGSQCGFCSPAQVMNMYGLLKQTPQPTMQQVENAFDASICRCTGYRPILDAMKSFASDAPPSLPGGPIDIEDLDKKRCSKTGLPCTGRCSSQQDPSIPTMPLYLVLRGSQWYKPTTKSELYSLLAQHKGENYRLVFGNSGFGVYKEIGPWMYDVLIDLHGIQEFYSLTLDSSGMRLGSNLSLTNLLDCFKQHSSQSSLPYLHTFVDHLMVVASTGVRNLGSWAGNLMLKNRHSEFPSDIFTMFETASAKLVIGDSDGSEKQYSLTEFLALDMSGKVILYAQLPVYTTGDVFVKTFKVRPRYQNAHAYVNAGFRVQLDKGNNFLVKSPPSLVYAGINKTLIHASKTETYLTGKHLGDSNVLKGAIASLNSELVPDSTPGLSSPAYRKSLAVCLFYKCVLGMCGQKAAPTYQSGGTNLLRPLSSGKQTFGTQKANWPVSEPLIKRSASLQTSGGAQFVNDVPPVPGELFAAFVCTTVGNATINNVDPSTALSMTGVVKYISVSDIPTGGQNNCMPAPEYSYPEEIFCSGQVLYHGQPIGLIIAEDQLTADSAARMVKVTYSNVKAPIVTMEDAIRQKSTYPDAGDDFKVGDSAGAIAKSDKQISGKISMGQQAHFQLETQISICQPTEDGLGVDILAATQWIDSIQRAVAGVLNISESSINVNVRRLGGAYGSKISRNHIVSSACALAAFVMRRPVRLMMNFHVNLRSVGKRFPYLTEYTVGLTNDGRLNGIKMTVNGDCGSTPCDSSLGALKAYIDNAYYCANWDLKTVALKTNTPANTFCRSPGSCPAIFIMESIMEHVAKALNKDPTEVRRLNLYTQGQKTPLGQVLQYCNIRALETQLETSSGLVHRKQEVAAFNQANKWKKKGLSVVPMKFGISWAGGTFNVFVTIYHGDGSVAIATGGVECGQGLNMKMIQVCAYELGIPMELIKVKQDTTLANSNSMTTGGSITSEINAMAVVECCNQLNARMKPVKDKMVNPTWKDLVNQCYTEEVDLTARYYTHPANDVRGLYNCYGVTCAEAEIDVLTGENQINRVDMLYDCGESMNPLLDVGQAEGGFVMGLGYWLMEQVVFDPSTGANLTDGTWEYKPPLAKDIPIDFRIEFLKNAPNPRGILRSKAVGEPPLCMATSGLFAVKHAIEAARKDASEDTFFPLNAPATVEVVQSKCSVDSSQLVFGT